MGAAGCCAENHQISPDGPIFDLPEKNLNRISDPFLKFEASLPFSRTILPLMVDKINLAEVQCGG